MLSVATVMLVAIGGPVDEVPNTPTLRAGVVAVIGIFGLARLGNSFIGANQAMIVPAISAMTQAAPWTFVLGLFFASILLYSPARPLAPSCRWVSPSASRPSS